MRPPTLGNVMDVTFRSVAGCDCGCDCANAAAISTEHAARAVLTCLLLLRRRFELPDQRLDPRGDGGARSGVTVAESRQLVPFRQLRCRRRDRQRDIERDDARGTADVLAVDER